MFPKILSSFLLICTAAVYCEPKNCSLQLGPSLVNASGFQCKLNDMSLSLDDEVKFVPSGVRCARLDDTKVSWACLEGMWRKSVSSDNNRLIDLQDKTRHRLHKRFLGSIGDIKDIVCLIFCSGNGGSADRTPPQWNLCPQDQFLTGIPGQIYAYAEWAEPKAYDDRDGEVRVVRDGKPPQRHFENGTTLIRYTAKDRSGNMAPTCSFRIVVDVINCTKPLDVSDGYYLCHPQNPFVLGSVCRFGCYDGFELDRPGEITCLRTRLWSGNQPFCKPWTCPTLPDIPKAKLTCTNENYFRSICTYTCESGYDMPINTARALICTIDQTWRKHGEPECKDIEPPVFQTCPSVIIEGADTGSIIKEVKWDLPNVVDNSGLNIIPTVIQGYQSGYYFSIGTHEIKYTAEDSDGNVARPCVFKVVVKEIRCHKLYPTPYMTINCPEGYKAGSYCIFICDPGKIMEGARISTCLKDPKGLFGSWSWNKTQPTCTAERECVPLTPPKDGAVVCDTWKGGIFCQFQCMNGTTMHVQGWQRLHVCSDNGAWDIVGGNIGVTDCEKIQPGDRFTTDASLIYYFYNGKCPDPVAQEKIGKNFQTLVETDLLSGSMCKSSSACSVNNIKIICGEVTIRGKRDVQNGTRFEVIISVEFPISQDVALETDYFNIGAAFQNLEKTLSTTNVSSLVGDLELTFVGIVNKSMQIVCPAGTTQASDSYACVECSAGTFYDLVSLACIPCNKGWYQDLTGQLSCKQCPNLTTTRSTGAISEESCESGCEPGQWSVDGALPCSLCDAGTYQDLYGQVHCTRCPGSQTTVQLGATHREMCHEFDIVFPDQQDHNCSLKLPHSVNASTFTLGMWVQSKQNGSGMIVRLVDGTSETICLEIADELRIRINGELIPSNVDISDGRWHFAVLVKEGCNITFYIDSEVSAMLHICFENIQFDTVLLGDSTFVGSISQVNIWSTVNVKVMQNKCFTGNIGDLVAWYFFEEADIDGAYMQITSSCDDVNECSSNPCLHGNCVDSLNTFHCTCNKGYTGSLCEVNTDDCVANVCLNGSTCLDGVDSYSCLCPLLYKGDFCEIKMVDGQWGSWSNWTECSVTCDLGIRTRTRLCNNPSPDNGGLNCVGEELDTSVCNETTCPVCPEIAPPRNGMLSCINSSNNINCTVHCKSGYDFDMEPMDFYTCGEETAHIWNFETVDNPYRRLPRCTEIHSAAEIGITTTYLYEDLSCASHDRASVVNIVQERAQKVTNAIDCITGGLCYLTSLTILNCDKERTKRATDENEIGFSITLSSNPENATSDLIAEQLGSAYLSLVEAAKNGHFTVNITGITYALQGTQTQVKGSVQCPDNMMRLNYYCVPCGEGSYLVNGYCQLCEYGYYQHKQGQTSCIACSQDWTTEGLGSISVDDCTVHIVPNVQDHTTENIIIACVVPSTLIVVAIVTTLIIRKTHNQKLASKVDPMIDMSDNVAKRIYIISNGNATPKSSIATSSLDLGDI
ncbi:hypothetical protein CHS0354_003796 [Potamilus streckersoni]|uniref:Sushi, von Willebrand factor type A, EGF and pentraxin domain-containing protein 1 n=1 Tax=Potamilus streckersoni TaxID=2493646 RepID=A0AAE0T2H5_9BIVA|nr:hypothetical protein CHS0354_003796 [Potamilus streckersoni]